MFITDPASDPYFNLAAEEYLLREVEKPLLRLWRSSPSVVIGRHQIPSIEVNLDVAAKMNVPVLRRLSGGGAVYHDSGNVNYSLISKIPDCSRLNFDLLLAPIVASLNLIGVHATHVGRGDLRLEGAKISGSSFYLWRGFSLHHGTLLFDADLATLESLLDVKDDGVARPRSVRSIRSPVTNIKDACKGRFEDTEAFMRAFGNALVPMLGENPAKARSFNDAEKKRIGEIADATYRRPDWNADGVI